MWTALVHLPATSAPTLAAQMDTFVPIAFAILLLGKAIGHEEAATDLVQSLRLRLAGVWRRTMGRDRPRVAVLEWTDPPYAPVKALVAHVPT